MQGFWPIFFLLVVLKIPVLGAIWLVWWASRPPEDAYEPGTDESSDGFNRWRRSPRPRGPHGGPAGGVMRPGFRARPGELASDGRQRVPRDGCEPAPSHARQAD
jgi:hypothetical protein